MKKALILSLMISLIVIALVSCGGNEGNGGEQTHTHSFGEWETVEPATCVDKGEKVRYCDCGEMQTGVISATGEHNEVVDKAVAPTCTEAGLTEGKHCVVCNEIFLAQTVVQKLEHTLDSDGVCTLCDQPIISSEGIAYEKSEDGTYAMVVGYDGTASKIRIADTYEGLPVTHINEDAFSNEVITSVVIPDSVTFIGDYAFYDCSRLTSVVIPDSVTTIGDSAFNFCSNLASVVIPNSITTIGERAFYGCSSLTSVVIPDSVTTIGDEAFCMCYNLTSVVIGDSVTTIGDEAFYYCDAISDVYYTGSEEEWKAITISSHNDDLTNATIHYNYVPEE